MMKYKAYAAYFALFGFFAWISIINLDPDLWWRLRLGKDILHSGIPYTDPYSYSMPSYRFVDHEWLTHLLMYINTVTHPLLNTLIFSLVMCITLHLMVRSKLLPWSYVHLLFISPVFLFFFGIKPQVLSWGFLAVLIYLLNKPFQKRLYFVLPIMFLLWANVHGAFVYGLLILLLFTLTHQKLAPSKRGLLLGICVFVTVINPYGIRMWNEVLISAFDPTLRLAVLEWRPIFLNMNLAVWFITPLYGMLFIRSFKHLTLFEKSLFIVTFMLGVSSSRNYPLWIISSAPIITHCVELFWKSLSSNPEVLRRAKLVAIVCASLATILFCANTYIAISELMSRQESNYYPSKAVAYLKSHKKPGNVFSVYNWGGYLIYKYPEKKVFIDGRMPSWKQSKTPNESSSALKDFFDVIGGKKDVARYFSIFHVDTVMIPSSYLNDPKIHAMTEIDPFIKQLRKNKFTAIYEDSTAIIYRRK